MQCRISGAIADVDQTVEGEPAHPAHVFIMDCMNEFVRVIVPHGLLDYDPSSVIGCSAFVYAEFNFESPPIAKDIRLVRQ
jgi:hypothetical protein